MELLFELFLGKPVWMWLGFLSVVAALLAFDLGVLNRKAQEIGVAASLRLSGFYILIGVAFGGFVWWQLGRQAGLEYLTGFAIEKAWRSTTSSSSRRSSAFSPSRAPTSIGCCSGASSASSCCGRS